MLYKNGWVVTPDFMLREADVRVSKGIVVEILPPGAVSDDEGETDLRGNVLAPGFIEMHIHGCAGVDYSSDPETAACLKTMSRYLASRGVAAFAPTAMTMDYRELCSLMERTRAVSENPLPGAALAGVYLEGPFLSKEKCAAQPPEHIIPPDIAKLRELQRLSGENIRIACVAPEAEGAEDFIREAAKICRVSAAHTAADYDEGKRAVGAGVSCATHLYNAMNDIRHVDQHQFAALPERVDIAAESQRAASGRNDEPLTLRQSEAHVVLEIAEVSLPAQPEDFADAHAFRLLDERVGVDQLAPGIRGKLRADGALAAAHKAKEDNVSVHHIYGLLSF